MDLKAIGEKLRVLRGERSMLDVANAVGVSVSAIASYEHGEKSPRDPVKIKLAKLYNTTVAEIFFD